MISTISNTNNKSKLAIYKHRTSDGMLLSIVAEPDINGYVYFDFAFRGGKVSSYEELTGNITDSPIWKNGKQDTNAIIFRSPSGLKIYSHYIDIELVHQKKYMHGNAYKVIYKKIKYK